MKKHIHLIFLFYYSSCLAAEDLVQIQSLESDYQNGKQEIRVLLPKTYDPKQKYRTVYVLPVFGGKEFGGFEVFKQLQANDTYNLIVVGMSFEKEPWYGDHASDPKVRQASYLQKCVVPLIEKQYSTVGATEGRLLFGFSKSGWGAFSLILKAPDFFGYAAAWDAPVTFKEFHYGMSQVYGTTEQLAKYRPDLLFSQQNANFQTKTRLVLTGHKSWGGQTKEAHQLMEREHIRHYFDDTLVFTHSWNKDWVAPTLAALMKVVTENDVTTKTRP
jgi:enterochelin esterase-like enzyme